MIKIPTKNTKSKTTEKPKEIKKIATPNVRTIEELVEFMNTDAQHFVKTLIYKGGYLL